MLDLLNIDIINRIIFYLNAKDTVQLLSTCQHIYAMRSHLIYKFLAHRDKILNLSYGSQFIYLVIDTDVLLPDYTKIFRIINYTGAVSLNNFNNLRELNMENYVCDVLPTLPSRLLVLKLPNKFNGSLLNILPPTLKSLHLGFRYNQPLHHEGQPILNFRLKYIIFSHYFNQELFSVSGQRYLPCSLIKITFGRHFNQDVFYIHRSIFSNKLVKLEFGAMFDKPLVSPEGKPYIPPSVKEIKLNNTALTSLGIVIDGKRYGIFPPGLYKLKLLFLSSNQIMFIPPKLKSLSVFRISDMSSIKLLSQLEELAIHKVSIIYQFREGDFPPNLQKLYINDYNQYIPASILPDGLQVLELGEHYERILDPDLKVSKIILRNKGYIGNIPHCLMDRVVIM